MAKPRILIVEDEWIIANDLKSSLNDLGYNVNHIAATGKDAINHAKSSKTDLVLMDIVLQGDMDGIEAAKVIISSLDIPVIYLTAYTDESILKIAKKSGAYGYLIKPFKDREMRATIELALFKHNMEKKLKESENQLFTTLKSINDAVISTNNRGIITFMNPLAQDLTGISLENARKVHLQEIFDIRSNGKNNAGENPINKIIKDGSTVTQSKFTLHSAKLTKLSIELSSAPIMNEKGTMNGVVIVFRDITDRIKTENELEEYRKKLEQIAEERTAKMKLFSDIVEKSPVGVQILDLSGNIIYSNSAVEDIYGISHDELIGKSVDDLNADPSFTDHEIKPALKKSGRWDGELSVKHISGNLIPIWLATFFVYDSNEHPMGVISIIRDLTERKQSEQALKNSEEKFSNLFQHSNDAIFLHDLIGTIIDANEKVSEQFGYTRDEITKLNIRELHPAEAHDSSDIAFENIKKHGFNNTEILFMKKNGSIFPAEISSSLIDIGGKPYIQGIVRDITERKEAETELLKHQERLEVLVKERTAKLTVANENLQQEISVRRKAEKQLLGYQKQLQSLTSQMSLIEENEKRRIATELHDCIGQTLALSKIKLGLLNKSATTPELKKIIKEILHLIEQTIKETRTLTFELSPPILYELGLSQAIKWLIDQFREKHGLNIYLTDDGHDKPFDNNIRFYLFQAIRELLVNIVKHAQATSAKITIKRTKKNLRIVIEDDGKGFSEPVVNYEGYGLFNIRERMNHINGKFNIKSIPGRGTIVTLVAPLLDDQS